MRGIDTNVVVRFLANDEPVQAQRARALVLNEEVFVPLTVFLEADWVLRSTYNYTRNQVVDRFRQFSGLPNVAVEQPERLVKALDLTDAGMDFADALHLGAGNGMTGFATFDRQMIRTAEKLGIGGVTEP